MHAPGGMGDLATSKIENGSRLTNYKWNWTEALPDTDHVRFFKSLDWSTTLVGAIADWSSALRQATYQVMADTRPATLYWYDKYSNEKPI
jgi:hypothetical protein